MKLTTIVLATAFALSGTFAFAQGTGTTGTSTGVQNGTAPATSEKMNKSTETTGSNTRTGGSPINSSQADYNSSMKDGSAPGASDPNSTLVGPGSTDDAVPGNSRTPGR
jgi:hypothetical protein